jgi:peptidoglycan/LPS O-acetylase OafA/YrhL
MKAHNPCLDLMRGVAAQAVLWSHAAAVLMVQPPPNAPSPSLGWSIIRPLCGYGQEAVAVFFVLSGYLIGHETYLRIRSGTFLPSAYTGNRLVRLYCVALPGLLLSVLLGHLSMRLGSGFHVMQENDFWPVSWWDLHSFSVSTLSCNLVFLQTAECRQFGINSSLWSLSNELFYYAIFPSLLIVLYCASPRVRILALAVLTFFVAEIARSARLDPNRPLIYAIGFLMWVIGAFIPEIFARLPRLLRGPVGGAAFLLAAVGIRRLQSKGLVPGAFLLHDLTIAPFTAWLIFNARAVDGFLARLPAALQSAITTASNYSYSLYFTHLPFLFALMSLVPALHEKLRGDDRGMATFCAVLFAVNTLCFGFYLIFERHYHRVQRWLLSALRASGAASRVPLAVRARWV